MIFASNTKVLVAAGLVGMTVVACGRGGGVSKTQEAWNAFNDPTGLGIGPTTYEQVPAQASLAANGKLWSGDGWATFEGGIAHRWMLNGQGATYQDFLYDVLTPAQVATLSEGQLDELSPAEKYDLLTGHTDFPLTQAVKATVLADVVGDDVPHWYGICHGWAASSTQELAPGNQANVQLSDGRSMALYAGDLEALLAYSYSDLTEITYKMIGSQCEQTTIQRDPSGRPTDPTCRDVNPASLHLALGELVGSRGESFILNRSMNVQVWNYPVEGYAFAYSNLRNEDASDPLAADRAPGTLQLVDVDLTIHYVDFHAPATTAPLQSILDETYQYSLELGAGGVILGGEWISSDHPDFLWQVQSAPHQVATDLVDYTKVTALRDQSRAAQPPPPVQPVQPPPPAQQPPGQGTGAYPTLVDGTPTALGVLKLVNLVTGNYLENTVGISAAGAAALDQWSAGDRQFTSVTQVAALVSGADMWTMLNWAESNGYVTGG